MSAPADPDPERGEPRRPRSIPASGPPSERRSRYPKKSSPPTLWIALGLLIVGAIALLITEGGGLVARFRTAPSASAATPSAATAP